MAIGLIGKKIGMTQIYDEKGDVLPVSVLQMGPCVVISRKLNQATGKVSLKLGYEPAKKNIINKPRDGVFTKIGLKPMIYLKEFIVSPDDEHKSGDVLNVELFNDYTSVSVTAKTIGKGFQGVMKRHNYQGGPGSHGSHFQRAPGSTGQCAWPSRVWKNKGMPGHMGNVYVTTKNLKVVKVYAHENIILIRGAVPGAKGGLVLMSGYKKRENKGGK